MQLLVLATALAGVAYGQQNYVTVGNDVTSRAPANPTYKHSSFAYTQSTTVRYAVPVPTPASTTTYAKNYEALKHLIGDVSTSSWGNWYPDATSTPTDTDDRFGQAAFSSMWESANLANFTRGIYSATVSPTPIPSSELVLPPSDPFYFNDNLTFPKDFMLGVAGSAAQIEGAIADEGRTPSVLDIPQAQGSALDYVTNENYYLYKQDIARLAAMGVKYYSFTIPWSRILPFVLPGTPVNQAGLDHYDDLINTVLEYGMLPMVTLTHFDTPLMFASGKKPGHLLSSINGAYYNETWPEAFINYGKIVMTHFADRVPVWVTVNEPNVSLGTAQGAKNVVLAHAELYKFYHNEIKGKGKVGIKFGYNFGVPLDPQNSTHLEAVQRFHDFEITPYANPIFLGQNQADSWISMWNSTKQNFSLTPEELKRVANTSDFLGIDPYTITVISPLENQQACLSNSSHPNWPYCVNQTEADQNGWAVGYRSQSYVYITPTYLRTFLNYLWNTFQKPVMVSEFGFPEWREGEKELKDQLFDSARSVYYRSFMAAILEAIHYDNVNVLGAMAWSFSDNWEFGDYEQQFGIQVVNRTTQERFYKKSFFDYVDFYRQRSLT
uniref:ARAD1B02354p n=1 Tax=Blastobotrys adeninivorans TaxID=409370 RepID=A0A060T4D0_BLAAD